MAATSLSNIPPGRVRLWLSGLALAVLLLPLATGVTGHELQGFDSPYPHQVALVASGAGSMIVRGTLGGVDDEFLLDTGASMVTVGAELFGRLEAKGATTPLRSVAARLASGRLEHVQVYRVERFTLGPDCDLGPVEVAVMKRGGRNLLGLSALSAAAPFAVSLAPPALSLSRCGGLGVTMR
jgi:predicted aspartyl protease